MGKNYYFKWTVFFVLMVSLFSSCQQEKDKYYEPSGELKGSAWEMLEKDGNYTIFLAATEKTGYKPIVAGRGDMTVMAPDDDAFRAYLQRNGYTCINDMDPKALEELIAYHLVRFSYNKETFANYIPYGNQVMDADIGLYYKFRTFSSAPTEPLPEIFSPSGVFPHNGTLYHKDYFLPLFTTNLFAVKGINAKSNYEAIFPGSTWTEEAGGFNIANASVTEYAIPVDNGYVYRIDRVLEPLMTVGKFLDANSDKYSMFREAYDRFANLVYDANATKQYTKGRDTMWVKTHGTDLPPIDTEWTTNKNGQSDDFADLALLSKGSFNIFAPQNAALQMLFDSFWKGKYDESNPGATFADININIIRHLLQNHVTDMYADYVSRRWVTMAFPEDIERGNVRSMLYNTVNLTNTDVSEKQVCNNGLVYGLNKVMIPAEFTNIMAPLYQYKKFTMALYAADVGGVRQVLNNSEYGQMQFFIPTDAIFSQSTLNGSNIRIYNPDAKYSFYLNRLEIAGTSGWTAFSSATANQIIRNHVVYKNMTPNNTASGQPQVWKNLNDFAYLIIRHDSVFTPTLYFGSALDQIAVPSFVPVNSDISNGKAFELKGGNETQILVPETNGIADVFYGIDYPAVFSQFRVLLSQAGMFTTTPFFDFASGDNMVMFIPSNDAIIAGKNSGAIPPSPTEMDTEDERKVKVANLREYLKRYIFARASFFTDYLFAGSGKQQTLSLRSYHTTNGPVTPGTAPIYKSFDLNDDGNNLSLIDGKNTRLNVIYGIPYIYSDGAAYLIDGLIKLENE